MFSAHILAQSKSRPQALTQVYTLNNRTNLSPDKICELLGLCLTNIYFQYNGGFTNKNMAVPEAHQNLSLWPTSWNTYKAEPWTPSEEQYLATGLDLWTTRVKIKTQEVQAFTEHIFSTDSNIKFTREDVRNNRLAFLDCAAHIDEDRSLHIGVYRKPTHRDQCLLFDSHHPLEH